MNESQLALALILTCPAVLYLCLFHTQMDFKAPEPDMCACSHDHADDCIFDNPAPQPALRRKPAMYLLKAMIGFWASSWSHPTSTDAAPPLHELESRLPENDGAKKVFVTLDSESGAPTRSDSFHSLPSLNSSASIARN